MLDHPLELAGIVNQAVKAMHLRSIQLPPGLQLRSDGEVLAAAERLAPEGQALPWAPAAAVHCRFPPALRAAARTLLLCQHSVRRLVAAAGAIGGSGRRAVPKGAALLDSLPEGVIQQALGLAAHPLEAWG
ncbi:hypothetical protein ABPG75_007191 [Micractinium tetrahymenae]